MTTAAELIARVAAAKPLRFVGKCKACGTGRKHEGAENYRTRNSGTPASPIASGTDRYYGDVKASEMGSGYDVIVPCKSCSKSVRCKQVRKHGSCTAPCTGVCTAAKGPNCDCSCQGANHGSGL